MFVLEGVDGLWGREAENAILYLYTEAHILASELRSPSRISFLGCVDGSWGRKAKDATL